MKKAEIYQEISKEYKELKGIIYTNDYSMIKKQVLKVHALVHPSYIYGGKEKTIADYVFDYLKEDKNKEEMICRMECEIDLNYAGSKDVPLWWEIWHTARIEDLVSNILVGKKDTIFNAEWQNKIGISFTDTGNALEYAELVEISKHINQIELINYADIVFKRSKEVLENLDYTTLKIKASKEDLNKIFEVGGLTMDKRSKWLINYWASLDIAGMILTPFTDHFMMHYPPCIDYLEIMKYNKIN